MRRAQANRVRFPRVRPVCEPQNELPEGRGGQLPKQEVGEGVVRTAERFGANRSGRTTGTVCAINGEALDSHERYTFSRRQ